MLQVPLWVQRLDQDVLDRRDWIDQQPVPFILVRVQRIHRDAPAPLQNFYDLPAHASAANGTFIVDAFGMQLAAAKLAKPPILFAIYFRLPITRALPIIRPAHTRSSCSAETTHSYAHLDADPMRRAVETIGATISAGMEENKNPEVVMLQKVGRKS